MSEDIYSLIQQIIPPMKFEDYDIVELESVSKVVFKSIGYSSRDFEKSFSAAWKGSVATTVAEFVFDVYKEDIKNEP